MKTSLMILFEAVVGILAAYLLKRLTGEHYERPHRTLEEYLLDLLDGD